MSDQPVALVVGASRGIGRQIAVDLAKNKYNVIVAAKTVSDPSKPLPHKPDPKSPESTITTVANEITSSGGSATAIQVDVRYPESVQSLVAQTIKTHGRLDVLVYNSGAIHWNSVENTPLKKFQLMQKVNPEGLYATIQACLPHLRSAVSSRHGPGVGRIVVVSPPIYSRFFRGKTAYAMGKVGMSVLTKGLAMDFLRDPQVAGKLSISSLWPAVAVESAATEQFVKKNPEEAKDLRTANIFSDAVLAILRADVEKVNGELLLDEDFLREHEGVENFEKYSVIEGTKPRRIMPLKLPDLTVAEQDDEGKRYTTPVKGRL